VDTNGGHVMIVITAATEAVVSDAVITVFTHSEASHTLAQLDGTHCH